MHDMHFIFDLGNVLTDFNLAALLNTMARAAGRAPETMVGVQDGEMLDKVERGHITDAEYLAFQSRVNGLAWTMDDLLSAWAAVYTLNDTGMRVLAALRRRGRPATRHDRARLCRRRS